MAKKKGKGKGRKAKGTIVTSFVGEKGCRRVVRSKRVRTRGNKTRLGYWVSKVDSKCGTKASSRKSKKGKGKRCQFGVSKTTGKCLKSKRAKKKK